MAVKNILRRPIVPLMVITAAATVVALAGYTGVDAGGHDTARATPPGNATQQAAGLALESLTAESLNASGKLSHVEGLEFVPTASVRDWAAVADVVVVAEATAEEAQPVGQSEPEIDAVLVGRTVTMTPIATIWTSPTTTRSIGDSFALDALGWIVNPQDPEQASQVVTDGGSRIDVGHTYVLALKWLEARCSADDGSEPAQWTTVGSGAALPLDDGVLGIGELVGQIIDDLDVLDLVPNTVLEDLAGQPATALGAALTNVQNVVQRIPFRENEPSC